MSKLLDSYASYLGTSPSNFSQLYLKMTGRRAGRIRPTVRPRRISPQFTPQFAPAIRLAVRPQFLRVRPAIRSVRRVRFPMAIDTTTSERASGGAGTSCCEWVLERGAWDDTQGQLGV